MSGTLRAVMTEEQRSQIEDAHPAYGEDDRGQMDGR